MYVASSAQFKWGQDEESPAIRDVLAKIAEVDAMWIEAQKEYLGNMTKPSIVNMFMTT